MGRPGTQTFQGPRSFPPNRPPTDQTCDSGRLPVPGDGPRRYGVDVRGTEPAAASRVSFDTGDRDLSRPSPGQVRAHARIRTPEEFEPHPRSAC
ncbi:hypothetical protein ACFVFS_03515 [Kitasatospora sp. NPDC057692]|uniref:hypothetical protein n=1 Tax=Kitasatospora sp. NPDC057692 TaxID=3346215 RepID=UPI0036CB8F80